MKNKKWWKEKTTIHISVKKELYKRIKQQADKEKMQVATFCRCILTNYINGYYKEIND